MVTKADIALVRSLSDKKGRVEHGLFVIEGDKMLQEALESDFTVKRVFGSEKYAEYPYCEIVSSKDIERMSNMRTPQGILALVELPSHDMPSDIGGELILALDGVQDPGNLGTIIRVADWFGINDIICSEDTVDCFNPKVIQATMGALFRVRVHYTDLPEALAKVKVPVYGTFLDGENIYEADIREPSSGVIVMGSEGRGIGERASGTVTRKLFIPSYPPEAESSESLNVAVATAIICAEFRRRLTL